MKKIVQTSLQLRVVVVILMILLMGAGSRGIQGASYDVFPEFAPPYVEIQVEAPGLSTAETEALIAVPIENLRMVKRSLKHDNWCRSVWEEYLLNCRPLPNHR